MTPRIRTVRDETGVALPLALFALVMLSGLLLAFLSMAGMEPVIAQNHASSSKAFYIADAGIEHALDGLQSPGSPALPQVGKPLNLFSGQVFGGGSYSVTAQLERRWNLPPHLNGNIHECLTRHQCPSEPGQPAAPAGSGGDHHYYS